MEQALSDVCKDIRIGKILIQTNWDSGDHGAGPVRCLQGYQDWKDSYSDQLGLRRPWSRPCQMFARISGLERFLFRPTGTQETMEQALSDVCKDIRIGKILIQTNWD